MRRVYEITFTLYDGREVKAEVEGVYDDVLHIAQTAQIEGFKIGDLVVPPGRTERYDIAPVVSDEEYDNEVEAEAAANLG